MSSAIPAMEAIEINSEGVLLPISSELLNGDNKASASVDRYRLEWAQILNSLQNNLKPLRDRAYKGELKTSKFRSICWALQLRVLNDEPSDWIAQRHQQRSRYEKFKTEFVRNPHEKLPNNDDDPLSQSKQSVWNQYFSDQELFAVLKQDVVRTFPGVDFFRKSFIQESMINILFYYAREHPYMCYRQGMHEILAPILFVMYSDHQSLLHFNEIANSIDDLLQTVLNPAYLEADSYSLFSRLMSSIESYYRVANLTPTAGGYFPPSTKLNETGEEANDVYNGRNIEIEVIGQLNFIGDKILAKEDLHLHNQLLKLDIPLPIFGIRWLRLLFGQEFPLLDLLVLWDAIFADSDMFELPNYIFVAMLIRIRDKLLLNDYTTCLTYLMKYPKNIDIGLILRHALHMYEPKIFERPSDAFVYLTVQPRTPSSKSKPKQRQLQAIKPQNKEGQTINRSRSGSLDSNGSLRNKNHQNKQLDDLQYNNAAVMARLSHLKISTESDRFINDGLTPNSPEYLQLQIQNHLTLISVTKMKLKKYLMTFRKHVNQSDPEDLIQAVEGLEELCEFLELRTSIMHSYSTPVDQALEASEIALKKNTKISTAVTMTRLTEIEAKQGFVQNLKDETINGSPAKANTSKFDKNHPTNTNLSGESSPVKTIETAGTRYEIPDNGYMKHSSRILGNRRDVELRTFKEEHKICENSNSSEDGIPKVDPLGCRND